MKGDTSRKSMQVEGDRQEATPQMGTNPPFLEQLALGAGRGGGALFCLVA